MKKIVLLCSIVLICSCSGNTKRQYSNSNGVSPLSTIAGNNRQIENAEKIICLKDGIEDYFGNEDFEIEDHVEEIDSLLYYAILKENASDIDLSMAFDKIDGEYTIVAENEDVVVLKDNFSSGDDRILYEYEGFIPKVQGYLFGFLSYERMGKILISKKDGKTLQLRGMPYFSVDNNLFCTLRIDEEGEACGTIEIFDNGFTFEKLSYGLWSFHVFPVEACWDNENSLHIKSEENDNGNKQVRFYKLKIKS